MTKRVVIIGAGISGLAAAEAAYEDRESVDGELEILVLERDAVAGGKATTLRDDDGWLLEGGPTGFLDNEPVLDRLVEIAGLVKLPANEAAARRFIVHGGAMREVKANPVSLLTSGLVSPFGLARMGLEPFIPRIKGGDETIWDFANRRLGRQAADRMIAPMVLGVFAGDAKKLSLPAAFPKMRSMEDEHGGLIKAMIAKKLQGGPSGGPSGPAGVLTSFAGGLDTLPKTLAGGGRYQLRCGATVESVQRNAEGWAVRISDETIVADAVVLAGEPWAMASLISGCAPQIAKELEAIYCPPVVVIGTGYRSEHTRSVPKGFGALIKRGEGYRMLGVLWDSHLFPGRSPEHGLLTRTMWGGGVDPGIADLPDEELLGMAREELGRLLGIDGAPIYQRLIRWPRAIPQYLIGHLDRVERIEAALADLPGLELAGNGLHGIAFGKAAAQGWKCGEAVLRDL